MGYKDDDAPRRKGQEEGGDVLSEDSLDGILGEGDDEDEDAEETLGQEDDKWE